MFTSEEFNENFSRISAEIDAARERNQRKIAEFEKQYAETVARIDAAFEQQKKELELRKVREEEDLKRFFRSHPEEKARMLSILADC